MAIGVLKKALLPGAVGTGAMLYSDDSEAIFVPPYDVAAAKLARKMLGEGKRADEIWTATRTQVDAPDVMLRQEIDDRAAGLLDPAENWPESGTTVGAQLDHPELYRHHPWVRDIGLYPETRPGLAGQYAGGEISVAPGASADDQLSTLLHELQHAVQDRYGWAPGGTPRDFKTASNPEFMRWYGQHGDVGAQIDRLYMSDEYADAQRLAERLQDERDIKMDALKARYRAATAPADRAAIRDERTALNREYDKLLREGAPVFDEIARLRRLKSNAPPEKLSPLEQYSRLSGEVEARNTELRRREGLYDEAPSVTQDRPYSQQFLRPGKSPGYRGNRQSLYDETIRHAAATGKLSPPSAQAARYPAAARAAMLLDQVETPLDPMLGPGWMTSGISNWLNKAAYGDDITWSDRAGVALDLL